MAVPLILVIEPQRQRRMQINRLVHTRLPMAEVLVLSETWQSLRLLQQLPVSFVLIEYKVLAQSNELLHWPERHLAQSGQPQPTLILTQDQEYQHMNTGEWHIATTLSSPLSYEQIDSHILPLVSPVMLHLPVRQHEPQSIAQ